MNQQYRIGNGYDIHRLEPGRKLILGGIEIPYEKGLLGHSDADVLTHAIMDAMLGALALGDIGLHFPPNDQKYKDISSFELLIYVNNLINKENYTVVNIDSVIMAENPKLLPHISAMQAKLEEILGIKVSIKATTMEGLGPIGEGKAIAASAIVLLSSLE